MVQSKEISVDIPFLAKMVEHSDVGVGVVNVVGIGRVLMPRPFIRSWNV